MRATGQKLSTIEKGLLAGALLLLIGLTFPTILALRTESEVINFQKSVLHSHLVMEAIDELADWLDQTESTVYGLVLDNQASHLPPAIAGPEATIKIDKLASLVVDNARQSEKIPRLRERIGNRLLILSQFAKSGLPAAPKAGGLAAFLRDGRSQDAVVHKLLSDMQSEEHRLMLERMGEANHAREELKWTIGMGSIMTISLLAVLTYIAIRSLTKRITTEHILRENMAQMVILNSDLQAAREEAENVSKLKSDFVANMSHEIRSPINAIVGMCNVLLKTQLTEHQKQYAGSIKEASNALLRVINDILDFSKIEAGHISIERVTFNPVLVVESCCEIVATTARLKGLSLMSFIEPQIPQELCGDPDRIRQVLVNLLSNAIKFSAEGEIVVKAVLESQDDRKTRIRFSVTDQGIGISAGQSERLFKAFSQADESITRRYGGTGLGLSICKSLVEIMNGTIGVESVSGKGSTFWFVLPLEREADSTNQGAKAELKDVKILIVDDELESQQILDTYVASWGMRNSSVGSVPDAIAALKKAQAEGDPFKLAIVDLYMPGLNGIDLAEKVLADPELNTVKLILLTGFDTPGLATQALNHGFKAYLVKPLRQSQLLNCLMEVACDGVPVLSPSALNVENPLLTENNGLVLIVEDHPINLQVAQIYLEHMGLQFHTAGNGREAVEAMSNNEYSLVLMDCQMPILDGFAATKTIRHCERLTGRHTPIVAMTAHAMQGDRERCLAAGMDDYLTKPIDQTVLRQALERWLAVKARTEGAGNDRKDGEDSENSNPNAASRRPAPADPIDLELLHARYQLDYKELLSLFVDSGPPSIQRIAEAARQNNWKALLAETHGTKGVCATICAQGMRQLCAQIESAAHAKSYDDIPRLVSSLEQEYAQVAEFIRKMA